MPTKKSNLKLISKKEEVYTREMLDKDIDDYIKTIGHKPYQILMKPDLVFSHPIQSNMWRGIRLNYTTSINKPWILV